MATDEELSPFAGGVVTALLLLGAIAVAAAPIAAGMLIGVHPPGVGEPQPGITPWALVHLLWMSPMAFAVAHVSERLVRLAGIDTPTAWRGLWSSPPCGRR